MDQLKALVEKYSFGVCSYWADIFGIRTAVVRMYFIYISFVALGSPLIVYLFFAFWMRIKNYWRSSKHFLLD